MRRRRNISSRFFIGIAVVVALCILSALYSGVTGNPSPVTKLAGMVVTPVQRLVTGVSGALGRGVSYFTDFDDLKAENEQLKKQIRDMEQTVRDAKLALEENDRLRQQAGQATRERELTELPAEVIARNPGDWATTLTLDKGSSHGVEVGDLVTTLDGMAGYVSSVAPNYCEVTSVIDIEMQCGALITRTRESAIAEGNYDLMAEGTLRLSYLTEDAQVIIGDTVETSGTGGVFPKGIMIGTVESVLPEDNGISYYAVIKPFVDVEAVSSVSIITDFTDTTTE
ncbi:MAG: rod shape-determining protein MreC [Agathobaculum sp.]|uniref:rod shape-determining protein MreC n=1 Tax=Agathobaculum sp. TaxID=2048138 RepID=UPI003D93D584